MRANPVRGMTVVSAVFPARKYFHFAEAPGASRSRASDRDTPLKKRKAELRFDDTLAEATRFCRPPREPWHRPSCSQRLLQTPPYSRAARCRGNAPVDEDWYSPLDARTPAVRSRPKPGPNRERNAAPE